MSFTAPASVSVAPRRAVGNPTAPPPHRPRAARAVARLMRQHLVFQVALAAGADLSPSHEAAVITHFLTVNRQQIDQLLTRPMSTAQMVYFTQHFSAHITTITDTSPDVATHVATVLMQGGKHPSEFYDDFGLE